MDGGGPNNAAVQQKRGVFHALPAPENYTTEYIGCKDMFYSDKRWPYMVYSTPTGNFRYTDD